MGVRFVHTADWQLGMRRHSLPVEAQARFAEARIDAIGALGKLAAAEGAEFIAVCGDVFESNHVDRQTVGRALEAMGAVAVPIYLLPGNHDPLDPGSIYTSPTFTVRKPPNVHVLAARAPVEVRPGAELVPAPWTSKRPLSDLVAKACAGLVRSEPTIRICVGHGIVDRLAVDRHDPAAIAIDAAERLLDDGIVHYVALGDRHSVTPVGSGGRIWYSGSPQPTDFGEVDAGHALVVDVDRASCTVTRHRVATWRFLRESFALHDETDVERVARSLDEIPDKARTIAKLSFAGEISLRAKARLDAVLEEAGHVFAGLEIPENGSDLVVLPDELDFDDFSLGGFARSSAQQLFQQASSGDTVAVDALALLYRLSAGAS